MLVRAAAKSSKSLGQFAWFMRFAQLTAQVASDQAAIDNAATQLGYATIRAPIDGVTGFRQVDIGNIVNASGQTPIVTITQVEPIFVVFTAPEDQLPAITAALRKGDVPVEAWSSDGLTKLAEGKLALFNNQVDTATGTIRLKAVYENKNHALWPGLSVSTKMRVGTVALATTVPDNAIQHGPDGLFAFAVDDTDRAHQRALKAGETVAVIPYVSCLRCVACRKGRTNCCQNIRVLGGAYGCMSAFGRGGDTMFVSYRDPKLAKTNEVYDGIPGYLEQFEADEREMTKYIIGTISELDTPLTPSMKGSRSLNAYFCEITEEEVQKERDEILNATCEQIRALASQIRAVLAQQNLCVIGNEQKIRESKELFERIAPLC